MAEKVGRKGLQVFLVFWLGLSAAAWAQTPIADLFRPPKVASATLSPDGKHVAASVAVGRNLGIAVLDLEKRTVKTIFAKEQVDAVRLRWLNNTRLVFGILHEEDEQNSSIRSLWAVNFDGGDLAWVMRYPHSYSRSSKTDTDILVGASRFSTLPVEKRSRPKSDVDLDYKVDGHATDFVLDRHDRVRMVMVHSADHSRVKLWYRDADATEFRVIADHDAWSPPFTPIAFDVDDKTLFVSAPVAQGRQAVFKFDFEKLGPGQLVAEDPWVDVDGGLVRATGSGRVVGVDVDSDQPRTVWLDTRMAAIQQQVDEILTGRVNDISPREDNTPMLVVSRSSIQPAQYFLFDPQTRKLKKLFEARPWIDEGKMSIQAGYEYRARDGLTIPGFLTLPRGRPVKNLPLVVLVHGGPWSRNYWGFDPEVQYLAGLGYAVLQPQFRGSVGFGSELFEKSFGQWGLSMQDDLTDGVLSLTKQGVVDPKRVCIMGASYGGYAAMMGVVKDPSFYRCAINLFGVTNIFYHHGKKYFGNKARNHTMEVLMGDLDKLHDQFVATSPAKQAQRIQVPVFMVYGKNDWRVPILHGEEMRDAMVKAGKPHEYMVLENEEHGLALEANRIKVYEGIAAFLRKHNPPD